MLVFDHANQLCTGSQLIVDIEKSEEGDCGYLTLTLRPQTTIPGVDGKGRKTYASFGNDSDISIRIGAKGIMHILGVLEGKTDSILGGKGLFVKDEFSAVVIHIDKVTERPSGYAIHLKTRQKDSNRDQRILLNPSEAGAIVKAVNAVFGLLAFGDFER